VFRVLADLGGLELESTEGTWNLGIGFFAVVAADQADAAIAALRAEASPRGRSGRAHRRGAGGPRHFEQGAKGVDGGAVRLVGSYSTAN
jgi:phosphoribosylformylglycinamidine cyclo-ligase